MEHFCFEPHMGENWFTYPRLYNEMVKRFPSGSHFVELGSWKGMSAAYMGVEIINSGKDIKFDCIDIWADGGYLEDGTQDLFGLDLMNKFLENVKPVGHIINAIRSDSVEASKNYADGSVDFVFIDGDHSYNGCRRDFEAWLPKMKPNGSVLAGHDYAWCDAIKDVIRDLVGEGDFNDPWQTGCFAFEIVEGKPVKYQPAEPMFIYKVGV